MLRNGMSFLMLPVPFLVLLFCNFFINLHYVSAQCRQDQRGLLLELKNNLTYDSSSSTKLVHWSETTDCCKWVGVKCDDKGYASRLDLSNESISGGIDETSSLFRLVHLRNLSLALNSFDSSELPHGFGKLTMLEYLNLSSSGFSGQIPSDISNLNSLVILDLSSPYSSLKLENPDLEGLVRNFKMLSELYLDGINISATGHKWCNDVSSLTRLRVLSMSNAYLTGPLDPSLSKLRSLEILRLTGNTFSSHFPQFLADFPNLRVLAMSSCALSGLTPTKLLEIPSLETVDLSNNRELEGTLPEFPLNGSLQDLQLSYTMFSGNLPISVANLEKLSRLDLRACSFSGPIPNSFENLTRLQYLDLSINKFTGSVPSFASLKNLKVLNLHRNNLTGQIPDTLWKDLDNLNFLDLSENSLQGSVPFSPFTLPSLAVLHLSNNRLSGSLREGSGSSSLEVLDLSGNFLKGPIPRFFFTLHNLASLSLARNMFSGSVELTDLSQLTDLASLDLSHNNLSVHISEDASIATLFPHLSSLMLSSCKLQTFPPLKNHPALMMLDLSENLLQGEVPNWIWEVGNEFLRFLNLSNNQFTRLQEPYNFRYVQFLDLHSNLLGGPIPVSPSAAAYIDFSRNNFSSSLPMNINDLLSRTYFFSVANNKLDGTIPTSICNATNLQVLDLSNNNFHGDIPSCLCKKPLRVLNLRRNSITGYVPDTFAVDCVLEDLDLSYNDLRGDVPQSLARCKDLEVLNLGNNALGGMFPCWLKNLSKLHVVVLRSNRFHGNMSCLNESLSMPRLQIMDLASNSFSGVLPENLFSNLKAMMLADENGTRSELDHLYMKSFSVNHVYYQASVRVTFLSQEVELAKILQVLTSLDFSDNRFEGRIPDNIGELKSLHLLNFSHNAFSGEAPPSLGNLQKLESLDLSSNNLGGEIPSQVASLGSLLHLNLSYNRLVGKIPQGNQKHAFSDDSFVGNDGLCGEKKPCMPSHVESGV